jgi:hypothetical protein
MIDPEAARNAAEESQMKSEAVKQLPQPGDRVGFVCGPCENPRDNAGTVRTIYSDRWYSNIALVLMDDCSTENVIGAYTQIGIGCYLIARPVNSPLQVVS